MTIDDFPPYDEQVRPPAGMRGAAGPLLRLIRDQRVVFLLFGAINTAMGTICFLLYHWLLGDRWYMIEIVLAYCTAVLVAFVLYRKFVFKVQGNVLRDLWKFMLVNLTALGVNLASMPLLIEVFGWPVLLSQLLVTFVTTLVSFFGHRGFSFKRKPDESESTGAPAS